MQARTADLKLALVGVFAGGVLGSAIAGPVITTIFMVTFPLVPLVLSIAARLPSE